MVFKPFTHLARQSLGKTFTHGYAQSVVAATQSSYASSNTPFGPFGQHAANRFTKQGTSQLHTSFQGPSTPSGLGLNASYSSAPPEGIHADGGLAAYYDAWQKQQQRSENLKEWKQFQFPKRIGWTGSSALPDAKIKERKDVTPRPDPSTNLGSLERAYSTSAVDDIKKVEDEAAEVAAIAKVDEDIATEINSLRPAPEDVVVLNGLTAQSSLERKEQRSPAIKELNLLASTQTDDSANESPISALSLDQTATTTPLEEAGAIVSSANVNFLHSSGRYAEIPPAFEAILASGLQPTADAYTALLTAAIKLTTAKHQIVPKALGVYADMLRRKVIPETAFYTLLIELLSQRAIDVVQMKKDMDVKRIRLSNDHNPHSFLFRSDDAEYAILLEDEALENAVKIFNFSSSAQIPHILSPEAYQLLVSACAVHGRVDDMIRVFSYMETHNVVPKGSMFPPMIEAFGNSGDLVSAVECYNGYKSLAMRNDAGKLAFTARRDNAVYAAVVKAYGLCGKHEGGNKFFGKVIDSFDGVMGHQEQLLNDVQDMIVNQALVQERLDAGKVHEAFRVAEGQNLTSTTRSNAMARICSAAADSNDTALATQSYQHISSQSAELFTATISMLALHIRQERIDEARKFRLSLDKLTTFFDRSIVGPITMYAVALIRNGDTSEGLLQASRAFAHVHASADAKLRSEIAEEVDEAIGLIGGSLTDNGITPSPQASMIFLQIMIENGGLVSPVSEQILAGLSSEGISSLSVKDIALALKIEAGLISGGALLQDIAHFARFEHLLGMTLRNLIPIDKITQDLVSFVLEMPETQRTDLLAQWREYLRTADWFTFNPAVSRPGPPPAAPTPTFASESFDPHAARTDYRGSAIIMNELDNFRSRNRGGLPEALERFKNMRRAGRHPRYNVYSKLIAAAAKDDQPNLIYDILGTARNDIPLLPEYPIVRHGWASILDSMVGACLTVGNRAKALEFHQELLDIGCAPTANTFGLYITTLKESTKTFDEATEAVKIFHRAKSEGVEPSSFLYNALIGKLGKARRIDDCMFYFNEMQGLRIQPTSVTYGTIVNALCRVSDGQFAEEVFDEMERMPNYKPRPAPYNCLMQFFLSTKRDSQKVLAYYQRMRTWNIQPTMHTYKLLIDTYATLEPINLAAAQGVFDSIRSSGQHPEALHYASLIHAKGCVLHDMTGARQTFDMVMANDEVRPQASLYQALLESMVANHRVEDTEEVLNHMTSKGVEMTPYIANTLIHGWATARNIAQAKAIYEAIGTERREPSTYEAMTRAFLTADRREHALEVVHEMLSRGYPTAVSNKITDLIG